MTTQTQIAELDLLIEGNTKLVEQYKALDRLMKNTDFKKVVVDGYFNAEAVRLVHAKADPEMQTPERQANIVRQMDSIGNLSSFFQAIRIQGESATKTVDDALTDRNEILKDMGNA